MNNVVASRHSAVTHDEIFLVVAAADFGTEKFVEKFPSLFLLYGPGDMLLLLARPFPLPRLVADDVDDARQLQLVVVLLLLPLL